tara:strand:- start:3808 stop:4164 length:357 start_codon:yes stop_codon:yes gene_type:complete
MYYFKECVKDIINKIPKEWEHTSYGNDSCPSYSYKNKKVFIDHPNPKQREDETWSRFSITDDDEDSDNHQMVIFETDNFELIIKQMENDDDKLVLGVDWEYDNDGGHILLTDKNKEIN